MDENYTLTNFDAQSSCSQMLSLLESIRNEIAKLQNDIAQIKSSIGGK